MEIARSGVFNPQMFTFNEIMVIFFAVMVTDIILLDTFNSLGLPTSTTVSIVFELLGSALAAAAFTLLADGKSLADVAEYINSSRSLTIISGILISVAVAFVAGTVVQYIARLIFTFNFEKMYRRIGGVYAGLAITAIFYFLVMKGAKGASFMRPEWIDFMSNNTLPIVATLFVVLSIVFQLLILVANVNVFKIIIWPAPLLWHLLLPATTLSTSWACRLLLWTPTTSGLLPVPLQTPSRWKDCLSLRLPTHSCCCWQAL